MILFKFIYSIIVMILPIVMTSKIIHLIYFGPYNKENRQYIKDKKRIIQDLENNEFQYVSSYRIISELYNHHFVGEYDRKSGEFDLLSVEPFSLHEYTNIRKNWKFTRCIRVPEKDRKFEAEYYVIKKILFTNHTSHSRIHNKLNNKIEKLLIAKFGNCVFNTENIAEKVKKYVTKTKLDLLLHER